ncbi:MAG: biopolymer transporter ExbD [Anderseniella sp.]|nr:biopolymer transporter ExbD [Anderseniella sp.]
MSGFSLPRPQRRSRGITILPLINVVFLLLIFIVLSGVISSPDPFELVPPEASAGEDVENVGSDAIVYVADTGELRFRDLGDETDVLVLIGQLAGSGGLETLTVRADAGVPAVRIVKLIERLRTTGIARIQLQAERRP